MEQFIFYRSYYEALKDLSPEIQAEVLMAIAAYALDDVEMELSGVQKALFSLVKPSLDVSKARSAAGKKGGRPQKAEAVEVNEKQSESSLEANEKQNESKIKQNESKPKAIKDKGLRIKDKGQGIKESNITLLPTPEPDGDGFEEFWQAYPRHVAKQAAQKAWAKLKPDKELRQKMLDAIERQKKSDQWSKDGGEYIPHPATWLNQARWEDELPEARPAYNGPDRSQSNGVVGQHELDAMALMIQRHKNA